MGMVVQHNMNAINAYNRLNANVAGLKKASEKLASGYRINRAGDDAAGLAISEKMRSQIKGLNQAVRNSQDGINMIQTYEGAAQETHSILQRMKELAAESANGTYDNATDRAAIQLEFDQLNDELNQIADTDFNGTVVLNGGVMADGTVAKDGEFRYADGYTEAVVAEKATDISGKQGHTIVDQSMYDKVKADAVWDAVGADVNKNQQLNVTFMFDGERWVADTVTDGKDNVVDGARASGLEARPVDRDDASGKGGFEVIAGKDPLTGEDIIVTNAIFDEMKNGGVKKGDTVTISFENSAAKTYAPKNVGLDECYNNNTAYKVTPDATTDLGLNVGALAGTISVSFNDDVVNDANMSEDLKAALATLDDVKIEATYEEGAVTGFTVTAGDNDGTDNIDATSLTIEDDGTIKWDGANGEVVLGTITAKTLEANNPATKASATAAKTEGTAGAITLDATKIDTAEIEKLLKKTATAADAGDSTITLTSAGNGTAWTIAGANVADATKTYTSAEIADLFGTGAATIDGAKLANGDTITLTYTAATTAKTGGDLTANGKVEFGINVDAFNFVDLTKIGVHAVETPKVATMASQVATPGVSSANSFKNSTGVLTYTDNLTLQTGARTKDSVNFAFSYNTDGTADMGNLVANLDLSARSTGLNTANLSLADQKSANYAIDQIDKAINKTSMVRATFGSIQNRLEHKITNLTTTAENLTEAESSIRDTDMASEMMNYTKFNILQQAAQSMLAQANQQPQSILQLLG